MKFHNSEASFVERRLIHLSVRIALTLPVRFNHCTHTWWAKIIRKELLMILISVLIYISKSRTLPYCHSFPLMLLTYITICHCCCYKGQREMKPLTYCVLYCEFFDGTIISIHWNPMLNMKLFDFSNL